MVHLVRSKRNYVGILNKTCDRRFNTDERAELGYGRMSMERENSVRTKACGHSREDEGSRASGGVAALLE